MLQGEYERRYREWITEQVTTGDGTRDIAFKSAIGNEFEAFGIIQREILKQFGLRPENYLIDVGCGSGRLAHPLSTYLTGNYLGTDISPELVDYARDFVGRDDWRFVTTHGETIPETDGVADMVCFFSVLTHLLHEASYRYLREAYRTLKPGGKVVFSFLEFGLAGHWPIFEGMVAASVETRQLDMFISRDAIHAWAAHLGFGVEAILDGTTPHTPLPHPVVLSSQQVMESMGHIGQSICVLVKM